jgi:predicted Holliday junction resolvase-like endonuclease
METLSFAFGMLTVVAVVITAVVIVGIVKVFKMQKEINSLERWISNTEDSVNARMNQELERISNVINDDRRELNLRIDELNRYTDSRFDKMENKFTNGNSAKKQIIND